MFYASKMANYASIPNHGQTTQMWKYSHDGKTPKTLKIATWNVNGFRSVLKKGDLQKYL